MAKKHPAKKYPLAPPDGVGPRAEHAAEILALEVGSRPYPAPARDRTRVRSIISYWKGKLGRQYKTRKMGSDLVVWRVA